MKIVLLSIFILFIDKSSSFQQKIGFDKVAELIQVETQNDIRCMRQFEHLTEAFNNEELWAIEWINSWGKLPSGVFSGHFESVGSYQQCVRARRQTNSGIGDLQGQHCMVYFRAKAEQSITPAPLIQLDWASL